MQIRVMEFKGTTQKLILVTLNFKKFETFLKIHESVLPQNSFFQLTDNTATTVFMLAWKIRVVELIVTMQKILFSTLNFKNCEFVAV